MIVHRGDIYYADLSPVVGSEQGGIRPVLIVQNDVGNRFSPTVIAAAITSQKDKAKLPTHIQLRSEGSGLARDSIVLLEQIRTLDKRRLKEKLCHLDDEMMGEIDNAIAVSLGLVPHGTRLSAVAPPARQYAAVASTEGAPTAVAYCTRLSAVAPPARQYAAVASTEGAPTAVGTPPPEAKG